MKWDRLGMRGAIVIPMAVFFIGNTLLRIYHKHSKASVLLDGAMSTVAPVKFFIFDRKHKGLRHIKRRDQGSSYKTLTTIYLQI